MKDLGWRRPCMRACRQRIKDESHYTGMQSQREKMPRFGPKSANQQKRELDKVPNCPKHGIFSLFIAFLLASKMPTFLKKCQIFQIRHYWCQLGNHESQLRTANQNIVCMRLIDLGPSPLLVWGLEWCVEKKQTDKKQFFLQKPFS